MNLRTRVSTFALTLVPALHLPEGFVDEPFLDGLAGPVGVAFDVNGRAYVWEREGRVFVVEQGQLLQPPLLDISDEVGSWRDFGMLGFALDPEFATTGDFYCYYVVDRHHLIFHGTPEYDAQANWAFEATIGRVTRFTADAATGFSTLVPGSRHVLLGETIESGVPILHQSHGTGSLVFGSDGTLLVSSGDGASYDAIDRGSLGGTYWQTGLADGIIRTAENVGAFRSQMIGSLNGKVLRLDPATGDGLPSNPFYDPASPRAPRSRVWALGLRNPFRMSLRPGSGAQDPALGNPGVLYVGDVGWDRWEELHVVADPGVNLGWPLFEGLTRRFSYTNTITTNWDAPNPLFGQGACDQEYFTFQDLVRQEREDHDQVFPNPCDESIEIPPGTPTFSHQRPALDWHHNSVTARVPIFVDGAAQRATLGEPDCPVPGESFLGSCAVGGAWVADTGLGVFSGTYLLMDFSAGWIRALRFDQQDHLVEVLDFGHLSAPVFVTQDPSDGSLLYGSIASNSVRRLRFTGAGNIAPQGELQASAAHGASPLTVRFDGSESSDPEGFPVSFHWDFGDGASSTSPSPEHVFENPGGTAARADVTLTVTDAQGEPGVEQVQVHLDNTPPRVAITSFENGARYSTSEPIQLDLAAEVFDAQSPTTELTYAWQVFLRHDHHEHPEPIDPNPVSTVTLTPTPCGASFYAYRVELTVTDPQGLATRCAHWLLPECEPGTVEVEASAARPWLPGSDVRLLATVQGPVDQVGFYVDGERIGTRFAPPYEVPWTPVRPGTFLVSALAQLDASSGGASVSSSGFEVVVRKPTRTEARVAQAADDAEESAGGVVSLSDRVLELGDDRTVAVRFALEVPRAATIVRAHLEWTAVGPSDVPTSLSLRAEASSNAPPLEATPGNLSGRPTSARAVSWQVEPWVYPFSSGARQRSPDLSELLQQVVDRPGFAPGNAVVLLLGGTGSRQAFGFAPGSESAAPRLVVDYAHSPPRPRDAVQAR